MTPDFTPLLAEVRLQLARGEDSSRLFHGRGNCFPGLEALNIDRYGRVVVFQLFEPVDWIDELSALLQPLLPEDGSRLLQERFRREGGWRLLAGTTPERAFAREDGLVYELTFMKNQNVGFFLDMRLGRQLVRRLAEGRRVLNLFAYTCSLSVAAVAGGAEAVYNMDLSKSALRTGKKNHQRNHQDDRHVHFLPHDILKSFGKMKKFGPYDLVIIDPPTFQKGAFNAEKDYARITRRLPEFLAPGAQVIACLNSPHMDARFFDDLFPASHYSLQQSLGRPPEFRERDADKSLKIHHYLYLGETL